MLKEHTYKVKGMHCASCEILIERKLLDLPGIKSVEASTAKGEATVEFEKEAPGTNKLNQLFNREGYTFFDSAKEEVENAPADITMIMAIVIIVGAVFLILNNLGFTNLINVNANSSLIMFFVFGLVAGMSSCAALVGGVVLSMSKQWAEIYSGQQSTIGKMKPHLMFNFGRISSFAIFGGILGLIGGKIGSSFTAFTPFLVFAVAVIMITLGLQMLGVKFFRRFTLTMPKSVTRYVADERNFKGQYMPALMGALTFFLPCGFTITAQGIALLSGSPLNGALIMLAFVLGTTPMLLAIGYSSSKLSADMKWSETFSKVAGVLVIFFAIFNINAQLNVLGFSTVSDLNIGKTTTVAQGDLPPIVDGKQIVKMDASATGYTPNHIKVRANVPVVWEINDTGTSGCTNAIISRNLFSEQIDLTPGQVATKEFTPTKIGNYKFSCWMGMINGVIEVVDPSASSSDVKKNDGTLISSGASGCGGGCGGGNGSTSCPMMKGLVSGRN